jgi:hypothetical protein
MNKHPYAVRTVAAALAGSATVVALVALGPPPATAAAPYHVTTSFREPSTFEFDCGDFLVEGAGTYSERFTVYFDDHGDVARFTQHVSAPADVLTNAETGRSITVRGHFTQFHERVPGTDTFDRTVTGFRYIVNQPGSGAVVREVGRVVYDDLDETSWSFLAGQHDWVDGALIEPGICDLLR